MFVAQAEEEDFFGFWIESVVDLFVDHLIIYFFGISENGANFLCGFGNRRNTIK